MDPPSQSKQGLNRTMVGLKENVTEVTSPARAGLNRTMVGLKEINQPLIRCIVIRFESDYGRIERQEIDGRQDVSERFESDYGRIER